MRSTLALAALFVTLGAALFFLPPSTPTDLAAFPTLTDATLADRTIVDFGTSPDGTVAYSYLGTDVPELLDEREVPELRTENSYTRLIAVSEDEDPVYTLESRFYTQPAYAQDADGTWKYLEYATTTEQAFRDRDMTLWKALTELVVRTAYADSVSPFSGAGDGSSLYLSGNSYADARGQASGNVTDPTGTTAQSGYFISVIGSIWEILRTYFPFDTSAIPAGATITAATLNVYVTAKADDSLDGFDYMTVVQTSQASSATLVHADYSAIGTTEGIATGERKTVSAVTLSAYLVFNLNSTGLGWIKKNGVTSNCGTTPGVTCLGIREGHDNTNTAPVDDTTCTLTLSTSEDNTGSGTDRDPYLSVTYTAPAITSGLSLPSGGININGGGLQIF